MAASDGEAQPSLALTYVRALLDRHGLPRYRQSAWLADAFGLSYSQAHRRLNGTSPWALEDLAQLAELFGESLSDLIAAHDRRPGVSSTLRIGAETISCRIWIGNTIAAPAPGSVFAVKSKSAWVIATTADREEGEAFEIVRLEARPATDKQRRVAVLDDDSNITASMVSNFELLGFSAWPFSNAADLLSAPTSFDCYVLDWVVDDETVLDLVASLREASPTCPIVILTGQVATGAIDASDIADAIKRYDLLFCEKPVRAPILAAMLSRAFAVGSSSSGDSAR